MKKLSLTAIITAAMMICCSCSEISQDMPSNNNDDNDSIKEHNEIIVSNDSEEQIEFEETTEYEEENQFSFENQMQYDNIPVAVVNKFNSMSLKERIYQMFIVTPECIINDVSGAYVTETDENAMNIIKQCPTGGIIFFGGNIQTEEQIKDMIDAYQESAYAGNGIGMFISVDEEGGDVSRVDKKLDVNDVQNMDYYGQNFNEEKAYEVGMVLAETIKKYGFNVDFAPVADINLNSLNGLDNRCFGSDNETVALMVPQVVKGLQNNNVCATLKHFPGIGSSGGDTHDGSVILKRTYEEMSENEFVPFKAGIDAGAEFVMVSHVIVDGADEIPVPSDLSYTVVTEWLKNDLGFEGIVITDAQTGMKSIAGHYSAGEAALMSLKAGIDIILMPQNIDEAYNTIANAAEEDYEVAARIEESVIKILCLKYKMGLLN